MKLQTSPLGDGLENSVEAAFVQFLLLVDELLPLVLFAFAVPTHAAKACAHGLVVRFIAFEARA